MRYYKLQINLELVDVGEMPEPDEQTAEPDEQTAEPKKQHPMLRDPLERQEQLADKALALIAAGTGAMNVQEPEGPRSTIHLAESYDVPSDNFRVVLNVLREFHELANRLGMPSRPIVHRNHRTFMTP